MITRGRIFALLWLCWGCNRSDAAPPAGTARSANLEAAAPVPPPPQAPVVAASAPPAGRPSDALSPAAAPCVVPLVEPPPPAEKPARQCPKDPGPLPTFDRGYVSFKDAPSAARIGVEIARTEGAREHGLMYRANMPEDQGMLFEWGVDAQRVFWMRNTCLPLDMLFIAKDGTVAGILEQVPVLNDQPRAVPCLAAYVLEVNAGYCRRHGIKPGMRMTVD